MALAERAEGWLVRCAETNRYLAPSAELIQALARTLRSLTAGAVLEVGAGGGQLARALRVAGVNIRATDPHPAPDTPVQQIPAAEALDLYQPRVVLGSFIPVDSGVDAAVLACRRVRHYLVLGARLGGLFGSDVLWSTPGWKALPLDHLAPWLVTRHDVCLDPSGKAAAIAPSGRNLLRHGEAWLFSRLARPVNTRILSPTRRATTSSSPSQP